MMNVRGQLQITPQWSFCSCRCKWGTAPSFLGGAGKGGQPIVSYAGSVGSKWGRYWQPCLPCCLLQWVPGLEVRFLCSIFGFLFHSGCTFTFDRHVAFFWFKLFWNKPWLCSDVSASDQTGYLPWVLSALCSVCSVWQPGESLCLWHSCETLQKVPRYTCFVPCVLAKGQWHRMLWLLKCGEEMHSGLQEMTGKFPAWCQQCVPCLSWVCDVLFLLLHGAIPSLFSGPENPDLERVLNLHCVTNLRVGH